MNYYSENDPKAAQWLRDLIWAGAISDGEVDTRSIEDVTPNDLNGYRQCHFFAGIGGWSLALRLAGWPDDQPVWTGSCPCQPFSAAGKGGGFADERHLWPSFFHLVQQCRPDAVFGEQVASPDGLAWFDVVQADLEAAHYSGGAVDICAAGVGAPHIRQRLYWLGVADSGRRSPGLVAAAANGHGRSAEPTGSTVRLADTGGGGSRRYTRAIPRTQSGSERRVRSLVDELIADGTDGDGLADTDGRDASAQREQRGGQHGQQSENGGVAEQLGNTNDAGSQGWGQRRHGTDKWPTWEASLVDCRDGKRRPVEPGTFPLAHGISGRVGLLRGYGNAIVPPLAAEFIGAYLDTI